MSTKLRLEDFPRDLLETLVELRFALREEQREDAIRRLLEQALLLEGKKGRGKSLSAVVIAWQLRELFDRHVITVGSKMGLKAEFGPFQELTEGQFRDALSKIQDVVEEEHAAEEVWKALKDKGVDLMHATIVFDEAYKLFDARNPMDKLTRIFGYFMAQQRHYHCTTLLLTPNRDMVDKRVKQQVDWFGRCFHNKWTHQGVVRLVSGLETIPLTYNAIDDSAHIPYYEMYDSWQVVGFRRASLRINKM